MSGVYRWTNKLNGKSYIGSSIDLGRRFTSYYSYKYISRYSSKTIICKALLKNGYSNFTLEILEYCNLSETITREQHYIGLFKLEYNILPRSGSSLGYKHSEDYLVKLKSRMNSPEQKELSRNRILSINKLKGLSVEVFNIKTEKTEVYSSIRKAVEAVGCVHRTIILADKSLREKEINKPINKVHLVKIIINYSCLKKSGEDNNRSFTALKATSFVIACEQKQYNKKTKAPARSTIRIRLPYNVNIRDLALLEYFVETLKVVKIDTMSGDSNQVGVIFSKKDLLTVILPLIK